jgi:PAS domain S-box-containing protein
MILQYSPAVIFMLASGTVAALLTIVGWRNRAMPISHPFILLMAAETVWIFGYAFELMSTNLTTVLLLNDFEYPALMTVPVAWLFVILAYTGREHYLTRRTVPLFFVVPVLVCIFVITNPYHHLYYTGFYQLSVSGTAVWIYEHGTLFWIAIAYCYLIAIVAVVLAAERLFVPTELYRRQTILLLCAAGIPVICNIGYVFRLAPFPEYDLTPIAFLVTGIILAVGLLRYQLFSAVPVAYSRVFSTMRDGVIVANREYRVIDLNPAAESITGISSRDAIGRTIKDVFPGLTSLEEETLTENRERRTEIQIRQNGNDRIYDVFVAPMDNTGTGLSGYLFLFRDITERKRVEIALAEANKKIGLLTSITRHDLSNKLLVVSNYLELSRGLATDPLQKKYLDLEMLAVDAMGDQIAFTQEYQRIGTDMPVWQNIDEVASRAKKQADLKNVIVKSSSGSLEVYADPMLEKVFYNLFDNAMMYGGPGLSGITISSRQSGTETIIVVEDDGSGISQEDKARLFEHGFGKNTGLGLFLSREILAITGIKIRETSEPGRGARFEICVPAGNFRENGKSQ